MKNVAMLGLVLGLAMVFVGCAPEKPKAKSGGPAPSTVTTPEAKPEAGDKPAEPAAPEAKPEAGDKPAEPAAPEAKPEAGDKPAEPAAPAAPAEEKKAEVPLDPAPAK